MAYTVRVVVSVLGEQAVDRTMKAAIRKAGGSLDDVELSPAPDGGQDRILTLRFGETSQIHGLVRSIENLRGVAVREVKDLKPALAHRRTPEGRR